ncbi:anthranilate synthase/aminodeoxychorismate synthase-like glutamine amidotransferase [Sphingomonas kaistensis]|uniref:anthranilate synthase n=1 Tax=Sphingomonas kaistensis TaxID=298708 RepID=A0A7X5Y7Q1_9SPHN|nr:gamma-glutamyl-gamma-aminobutyrate hydrolase family protein [Sphingomonas kaistensis]NJC05440.1 anthranilate synthase/aminodeoxychorismate synthase-like glutamine amidotransferase [Sphingomonas kaistensis]
MRPVLLIDNLDSFTFNLVESLERIGVEVHVRRNGIAAAAALAEAEAKGAILMISPGPGTPQGSGCCLELIALARGRVPLLGICLGHQAIVEEAGGTVTRAPEPVHGKSLLLEHDGAGPFAGLPSPVRVARYHSLCTRDLPPRFTVHAQVEGMAMAFSDPQALQAGLQFHPESMLTTHGDIMLRNLLAMFG